MSENIVTYYKDKIDVPDILQTMQDLHGYSFEEPFYICDLSDVVNKFYIWKKYMPRVEPFYAVKCNFYYPLLEVLAKLGAGFDCASANEIMKIQSLGVNTSKIIYANPSKQISHILYAKNCGVKKITFDSECELYKIQKHYPDAELLLRFRCDAKIAVSVMGPKSGCDPKTEACSLIELAMCLKLKIVGVCFHVGSGCKDYAVYKKAIQAARKIFNYSEELGMPLSILDIGGSFRHDKISFLEAFSAINKSLEIHFPDRENVRIISEPGRYFASEAFTLVSKIHTIRETRVDRKPYYMYYINAGIHGAFGYLLYGPKEARPEYIKETKGQLYNSTIWGPTCDPNDKLFENILMPKLDLDDVIIFRNLGAYTTSLANSFNGFSIPDIRPYINVKHESVSPNSTYTCKTSL